MVLNLCGIDTRANIDGRVVKQRMVEVGGELWRLGGGALFTGKMLVR